MQAEQIVDIDKETPQFRELYDRNLAEIRDDFDRRDMEKRFGITLRTETVAELLDSHPAKVRELYKSGKLDGFPMNPETNGSRLLFPANGVLKYIAETRTKAQLMRMAVAS